MRDDAIRELWAWFADRAPFLARNTMNEAMHAELDARVSAWSLPMATPSCWR